MARSALPAFDGPRPQYFSLMMNEARILGQVRSFNPADEVETTRAGRVGSSTKKTLKKSKNPTFTMDMWVDNDLQELAVALNAAALPTSGNTVKLDPEATGKKWRILHYDGETSTATLLSTTYLTNAVATSFSWQLDAENEQVATIAGEMSDLYTVLA